MTAFATSTDSALPHLRGDQLIVDGQPFLVRGGELSNSSGEPDTLRSAWTKLRALNLNTVLAPVYWNLVEPEEGRFDFATVDGLIADARANDMRLVLLWFGSWKNSMSSYAPAWVKRDTARFPRVLDSAGRAHEILSPFIPAAAEADARAFAALMRHLRENDREHTVIMVQVENEIGMIPEPRDHRPEAERAFAGPVPAELMTDLRGRAASHSLAPELIAAWTASGTREPRMEGTWAEVFGEGVAAEEIFMAWHFARYTEQVAAAGRVELALPLYTNAALIRPGYQPGQYPSGGPLPHLFDVWRAGAPSLSFLAPDIYFQNFTYWARAYTRGGNPLFIPEALRSGEAAVNALYAFGEHGAIGFSPFAIESTLEPAASYLAASYDLVRQLTPLLTAAQAQDGVHRSAGFLKESAETKQPSQVRLGQWIIHANFERSAPPSLADGLAVVVGADNSAFDGQGGASGQLAPAGGLVIALDEDEFLFAGIGLILTFAPAEAGGDQCVSAGGWQAGLLDVAEGHFDERGEWQHLRWLNGDQTHQGRHVRLEPGRFSIQRVRLYRYR